MKTETVKVQVPLIGDTSRCLIYDRHRRRVIETLLSSHVKRQLAGDLKGYFEAVAAPVGGWDVYGRLPDQTW